MDRWFAQEMVDYCRERNQWDIPVEIDMEPTKLQLPEHHLPDIMFGVALDAFRVHLGLSKSGETCT